MKMRKTKMTDAKIKESIERDREWMNRIDPDEEIEVLKGMTMKVFDGLYEDSEEDSENEDSEIDADDENEADAENDWGEADDEDVAASGKKVAGAVIGGIGGLILGGVLGAALMGDD